MKLTLYLTAEHILTQLIIFFKLNLYHAEQLLSARFCFKQINHVIFWSQNSNLARRCFIFSCLFQILNAVYAGLGALVFALVSRKDYLKVAFILSLVVILKYADFLPKHIELIVRCYIQIAKHGLFIFYKE